MGNNKYYLIKCPKCGVKRKVRRDVIKKNQKCLSCSNTIHGLSKHPAYNVWCKIRERCEGRG